MAYQAKSEENNHRELVNNINNLLAQAGIKPNLMMISDMIEAHKVRNAENKIKFESMR
jgi:hypothetical protein